MAESVNNIIYKIEVDSKTGKINVDGVTKSFEQADKAFLKLQKDVSKGLPSASKAVKGLGDASGSATSSVMELSRVVSDAPYGIRGMANNITQLVSQMGTATVKAGGFGKALKEMGQMMMGPLGIVFAITVAVSALDFFKGGMEKASTAGTTFKNSIKDLADTFKNLQIQQSGVNDKINEYIDLSVKKAELEKVILKSTERLAEISKLEDRTIKKRLQNEEELSGILSVRRRKILEQSVKVAKRKEEEYKTERRREIETSLVARQKLSDEIAGFNAAEAGTLKALKTKLKLLEVTRELVSKDADEYDRQTLAITAQKKLIEEIEGRKTKGSTVKKISPFKTPKELNIDIKNADNAIIQYEKKIQDARLKKELNDKLSEAKTEEDKATIRKNYEKDRLINQMNAEKAILNLKKSTEESVVRTKTKNHIDELKRKYTEFITELDYKKKLGKISEADTEKLKEDAAGKLFNNLVQADTEEKVSIEEISEKYKPLFSLFNKLKEARLSALFSGSDNKDTEALEKDAEELRNREAMLLRVKLEALMEASQAIGSFIDAEYQREITKEQNKTNALNNELRERLNNENISVGERKSIQLKIARNDEALRIKQEAIEKKRFKTQKAINVAQALISTYLAVAQVQANPLLLDPVTKGISMAATLASGLANVAILSRQKFQSSAGATSTAGSLGSGGGSGGGNDRSFDFNLAGTNQQNQLAQTLQGRFDQPLQAYVVGRDITNQQQLDQEILSSSSFG